MQRPYASPSRYVIPVVWRVVTRSAKNVQHSYIKLTQKMNDDELMSHSVTNETNGAIYFEHQIKAFKCDAYLGFDEWIS